jgi:hypothetical protein
MPGEGVPAEIHSTAAIVPSMVRTDLGSNSR